MNTAPPFSPAIYGNLQMLPNPMTEPPTAATAPNLLPKDPLFSILMSCCKTILLQNYQFLETTPILRYKNICRFYGELR